MRQRLCSLMLAILVACSLAACQDCERERRVPEPEVDEAESPTKPESDKTE